LGLSIKGFSAQNIKKQLYFCSGVPYVKRFTYNEKYIHPAVYNNNLVGFCKFSLQSVLLLRRVMSLVLKCVKRERALNKQTKNELYSSLKVQNRPVLRVGVSQGKKPRPLTEVSAV